jgi:hypothetical protein
LGWRKKEIDDKMKKQGIKRRRRRGGKRGEKRERGGEKEIMRE